MSREEQTEKALFFLALENPQKRQEIASILRDTERGQT